MAVLFKPGLRVVSLKFGIGTIRSIDQQTAQIVAHALDDIIVRVPLDELEPTEPAAPPRVARSSKVEVPGAALLRSVEALRFGIVPGEAIPRLTVGFERLAEWTTLRLPVGRPVVSEVCGSFGTGKSHAMAVIRHVAAEAGYVTASVEVDGRGVTLADPGSLLFNLLERIEARNGLADTPMLELNRRGAERGYHATRDVLTDFPRILANFDTVAALKQSGDLDAFETTLDSLLGGNNDRSATEIRREILAEATTQIDRDRIQPKRLVGVGLCDRSRDFADSLLGYARLATRAGFKGLVITLDEFEVEYRAAGFTFVSPRVVQLIDLLAERFADEEGAGPLGIFIAAVGQSGDQGDAIVERLLDSSEEARWPLRKWSVADLRHLAKRAYRLYAEAYGLSDPYDETLTARSEAAVCAADSDVSGHVRSFVKGYIAELDSRYGPPVI